MKYRLLIILFFLAQISLSAQVDVTPFLSTGYITHLGRRGANIEMGTGIAFFKRAELSFACRYSYMDRITYGKVKVTNLETDLSFAIIKAKNSRLLIGTGLSAGRYFRINDYDEFDKDYNSLTFNPVRIQYDYTLKNRIRIGVLARVTGDDGDGSTYAGLFIGYKL